MYVCAPRMTMSTIVHHPHSQEYCSAWAAALRSQMLIGGEDDCEDTDRPEADAAFHEAMRAYDESSYEESMGLFGDYMDHHGCENLVRTARAWMFIAKCAFNLGECAHAVQAFDNIVAFYMEHMGANHPTTARAQGERSMYRMFAGPHHK